MSNRRRIIRTEQKQRDHVRQTRSPSIKKTTQIYYNSSVGKTQVIPQEPESPHSILLTGGVGDFLALESMMSHEERTAIHTICYATRQHISIRQLIELFPSFSNVKDHIVVWDDWSSFFCFLFKSEVLGKLTTVPEGVQSATDFGITRKFPEFNKEKRTYINSSPMMYKIADVSKFNIVNNYICICPYSVNDKRSNERDFTNSDWSNVISYLTQSDQIGIILNVGEDSVPKNSKLIDLSNMTTFAESIEILKGGKGYIGIDSALSVIAAKLFSQPNIHVKSKNKHLKEWQHIYYSPLKDFSFIVNSFDGLAGLTSRDKSSYKTRYM